MRSRGEGKRRGISACLGVVLAFLMVTAPGADYRTLYGDGLWHDMGGGWWYAYNISLDDCYWRYSGVTRFAYDYDGGQWWDYRSSWGSLGASGIMDDDFIGDGAWHSLNNGWTFAYNKSISDSYFNTGSAVRFGYDYDGGQWWHYRTSWYTLGGTGESQSFIGDGNWHVLNDGWAYGYNKALNDGYWWSTVNPIRFSYDYDGGQWWHFRQGTWLTLGGSSLSQSFIGDGAWHNLNDGWAYAYNYALNDGYWNTGSAVRFSYDYDDYQWWHYGTSWSTLGAAGLIHAFIGDGNFHNTDDGWAFAYNKALNDAYWGYLGSARIRFSYDYDAGQWWDLYGTRWNMLGLSNYSQAFIGDAALHTFTGGGSYIYSPGDEYGYWGYGSAWVYKIDYKSNILYSWDSGTSSWTSMTSYVPRGLGSTPLMTYNPEIRYVGDWSDGRFVETRLCYWGSDDYDLFYDYVSWSTSGVRTWLTDWAIFNPGADHIWSGTNGLKIGFLSEGLDINLNFSREDVIHFYNIDASYKNYSFAGIVALIHRMTQFYGTQADTVAITQGGLPDQLGIGTDTVTSSNVSSYASLFTEWGAYMKSNGQIHFNHPLIAAPDNPPGDPEPHGVVMLNAIASYTQADIFASDDKTQNGWPTEFDWYMEYASNGNSLSYNCIYNYNTTWNKPYDPEWWEE